MIEPIKNIDDVEVSEDTEPRPLTKAGKTMNWLLNRLKEKTTWRGIFTVLTVIGISISPELKTAIITAGVSLVGLLEVIFKEPQSEDA